MTRTRVLALAVVASATLIAGMASAAEPAATTADPPPGQRPNVVMIVVDDLDALTSPYWEVLPQTATLIRDHGRQFSRSFAPDPVCCPARSTLLTGKYAHNTGVLTNDGEQGGWDDFVAQGNEERTLAVELQAGGYRTALVGKYLNGIEDDPTHIAPGWNRWFGLADANYTGYDYTLNENGRLVTYGDAPQDYLTDVLAAKATTLIRDGERDDDRPMFLYLTPTAPHIPIPPAPRHTDHAYAAATVPRNPNFDEPDVSDKPSWLQASATDRSQQVALINDGDYQDRMGSLLAVDDMVAAIVHTLEQTGELDNTYLLLTSDNGYNLGAHRLIQKMAPYEESLRVPMVITGPGIVPGVEPRMVIQPDVTPTILQLAGLPLPSDVDGRSLVPLLGGVPPEQWRTDFIGRYRGGGLGVDGLLAPAVPRGLDLDVPTWRGLRTEAHTYVEWYPPDSPHEYELYNLRSDPWQLENLLATPQGRAANATLVEQLRSRLNELDHCAGATCRF